MDKLEHLIIITPERSAANYWCDLYRYRELFYVLSWRGYQGALQAGRCRNHLEPAASAVQHGHLGSGIPIFCPTAR